MIFGNASWGFRETPLENQLKATKEMGLELLELGIASAPDDVPLAFQNTQAELTQCGHDSWKWSAEGDNHGKTMKIMDHWYYFEACF